MGYRNAPGEPGRPSREQGPGHRRFGALCREERGQSLVVIVIAMTLIVLVAAVAIDVSDWFAKHHQAQVTADAAALAAANYMGTQIAETGSASSANGTAVATTYAAKNGLPINSNDVTFSGDTVTVTVPTTGPLFFAGISLGSGPSISARAVASWAIRDCTSAGTNCAFMFAGDNVCTGTTGVTAPYLNNPTPQPVNHGVTVAKNGIGSSTPITGDVVSASNITTNVNPGNYFDSTAYYQTGCTGPSPTNPSPFTAADPNHTTYSGYPIPYDKIYPGCPGTSTTLAQPVTCKSDGYPSYCTIDVPISATPNVTYTVPSISGSSTIFCDAGSGTASDPSTWNGIISDGIPGNATFIAGAVDISLSGGSSSSLGPASGSNLLAYAAECNQVTPSTCSGGTSTTSPAVEVSGSGSESLSGDIFVPAGTIDFSLSGTPPLNGFLEAWDIVYNVDGTAIGQGPPVNNQGYFVGDYLIQ